MYLGSFRNRKQLITHIYHWASQKATRLVIFTTYKSPIPRFRWMFFPHFDAYAPNKNLMLVLRLVKRNMFCVLQDFARRPCFVFTSRQVGIVIQCIPVGKTWITHSPWFFDADPHRTWVSSPPCSNGVGSLFTADVTGIQGGYCMGMVTMVQNAAFYGWMASKGQNSSNGQSSKASLLALPAKSSLFAHGRWGQRMGQWVIYIYTVYVNGMIINK
jgi:hypothetical protein